MSLYRILSVSSIIVMLSSPQLSLAGENSISPVDQQKPGEIHITPEQSRLLIEELTKYAEDYRSGSLRRMIFDNLAGFLDKHIGPGWLGARKNFVPSNINTLNMFNELLELIRKRISEKANKEEVDKKLEVMREQINNLTQNLAALQARLVQSGDIRKTLEKPVKRKRNEKNDDQDAKTGYLQRQNDDLRHQLELQKQRHTQTN